MIDDPALESAIADLTEYRQAGGVLGSALTGTGAVEQLEHAIGSILVRRRHILAVCNGTAALHLAMRALGIGRGDEVIASALDWPAATGAIRGAGATPVHVDVDLASGLVDPLKVETAITPTTAAVVVTHLFGLPAPAAELRTICDRHGLALIEDCAQALGATASDQAVGSWGDAAAFSFGTGKVVDAEEGGALAFADRSVFDSAVRLSQHPLRQLLEGLEVRDPLAPNYRIHPVAAALAVVRLRRLRHLLSARRAAARAVFSRLEHGGIDFLRPTPKIDGSTWHRISLVLMGAFANRLNEVGLRAVRGPLTSSLCVPDHAPVANYRAIRAVSLIATERD